MRVLPCGPRARLVEHEDPTGYAAGVRAADLRGLLDVIPAERTVLVTFDRLLDELTDEESLRTISAGPSVALSDSVHEIPVMYDGQDLAAVSRAAGMSTQEVIAAHAAPTYTVAFCGFAPGFAYLRGTDPRLQLPRRATPRPRVPAGSVAIAADYSAIYPLASPGGWHLLGRTHVRVFDPGRDDPALLIPGTRVRFLPVDTLAGDAPTAGPTRGTAASDGVVEVIDPGPLTLLQDLGRCGFADISVGTSGAFDRPAHRLANRLLGNPESAATLETLGGGLTLRAKHFCVVAVTGAQGPIFVDGIAADLRSPLTLSPGQVLRLGPPSAGLRSYVALRGGPSTAPVLGSRSSDTLSTLGPPALEAGTLIGVLDDTGPILVEHAAAAPVPTEVTLRLHPGPRGDRLTAAGFTALADGAYVVSADSSRIGLRLIGPTVALHRSPPLASEGVIRGSVQVPPDGQPVVLGPDHPVTGGYPVVGIVDDADTDLLAQAIPGTPVRFAPIGW